MRFRSSLRTRVATAFLAVGGGVSLLIAFGLYFGARDAGERLIDETLSAEMQDYVARRARNPNSLPPATATLLGFVDSPRTLESDVPPVLAPLAPGRHSIEFAGALHRVLVSDQASVRYYLLYNETLFRERQLHLTYYLAAFVVLMSLLSAGIALWLAERVIEPVKDLARRVRGIGPDTPHDDLTADFPRDEVGELAHAFEQSLARLSAFIQRERAFTADVSHELRTPLAVIRGAAEVLLADETRPESDRRRLERIERAAADMADLATALLAMAREKDEGRSGSADLATLVEESVEKHRSLLRERPVSVQMDIAARPKLAADPNLLAIVIANLVRNSFCYTERGSVRLHVADDRFTVIDTGQGIPREALAKVFERLYRGPASDGAGIGLSLVKKICDRYGWAITLESKEGKGTQATLRFKAAPA